MARYPRDAMGVPEDMLNISDRKVTAHEFACLSGSGSHNRKTYSSRHAIWGFSVQSHREGRNEEKADGRSARMLAYKSQNTGRVGDVRILKWITALVALLSLMSLVGCTTRTIESINLTPENTQCRASAYEGWIQVSSATVDLKAAISSAMASAGVLQPSVFLGRLFISAATSLSQVWLASLRSVPFGMN